MIFCPLTKFFSCFIDSFCFNTSTIIEGFKKLSHPKIEVIRNGSENYLFKQLTNIIGIVSDNKINTLYPQFKFIQIKEIAELILNKAKNE